MIFADGEREDQRGKVTYPRSQRGASQFSSSQSNAKLCLHIHLQPREKGARVIWGEEEEDRSDSIQVEMCISHTSSVDSWLYFRELS